MLIFGYHSTELQWSVLLYHKNDFPISLYWKYTSHFFLKTGSLPFPSNIFMMLKIIKKYIQQLQSNEKQKNRHSNYIATFVQLLKIQCKDVYYLPLILFSFLHRCPSVTASKRKQILALMEVGAITSATSSTLIGYKTRKWRNMNRRINDGVIKFGNTKNILTVN